jgi:hypothetical protein
MQEMSDHCPFLNRSDRRCSEVFRLSQLQHAFKFCFNEYHACPVYAEQLAERQGKRAAVAVRHGGNGSNGSQLLVTVSIPTRYAQPQRAA